jgi:hypothetical protein
MVFCGKDSLAFETLRRTALLFMWSGWYHQIAALRKLAVDNIEYEYGCRGFATNYEINEYRKEFRACDPTKWKRPTLIIGEGVSKCLEKLLLSGSRREASDPRDYVYANLSLAIDDRTEPTEDIIVPDYSKTTEEVYIETTKFIA